MGTVAFVLQIGLSAFCFSCERHFLFKRRISLGSSGKGIYQWNSIDIVNVNEETNITINTPKMTQIKIIDA